MNWQATVDPSWSVDRWRALARHAWMAAVPPEAIDWCDHPQPGLFGERALETAPLQRAAPVVPAAFLDLAARVLCHRDPARHALLYRVLWRLGRQGRALLARAVDPDIRALRQLEAAVRRDVHKMKAFVRFRAVPGEVETYAAWFEPEHWIVDRVAPFFQRRFAGMRWAIVTPDRSAVWNGGTLWLGPGGARDDVPPDDAQDDLWRTYYASIFNPARLNPRMMCQEMPRKYWANLPEARLLPALVRDAGQRVQAMVEPAPRPADARGGVIRRRPRPDAG